MLTAAQRNAAAASGGLESRLKAAEAARMAAEENASQLQGALEKQRRLDRENARTSDPELNPGDVVPAPPAARTLSTIAVRP